LDQRFIMLPRLTRNVPGISGGASHSPDGSRTARPGTSVRARIVMNERLRSLGARNTREPGA